jgi:formylglycine-generating enzyme required for sulfatase activity
MGRRLRDLRSSAAWAALAALALVSAHAHATEHKVAVNVRVARGLKLNDSDLARILRGQLGRYGGVVALPEGKTKDAIAEERASTNSKCRSGVLDQKCQLALGSALAASHWLEVTITRPGKKCELSLEYLSIVRESSDGGDVVRGECDRESVALGLERGVETIARKVGWSGAGVASTFGSTGAAPVAEDPNDPVAQALRKAETAKASAAAEAESKAREAAERVQAAEKQWPTVRTLANDRSTPVEARLEALRAFSERYSGTDRAQEADALARSLEAEQARAAEAAAAARAAEEAKRAAEEAKPTSIAEMVSVPAGKFFYGCNAQVDSECEADEKPGRRMTLPGFRIDRTEVTVAAYRACVQAGRCSAPNTGGACNWDSARDDHPVNCVDWGQARAYCAWRGKRLPTEREWEKAARGTDGRKYAWGNEGVSSVRRANTSGTEDGWAQTSPVGAFPSSQSPCGAMDLIGNVWEWCEDEYSAGTKALRGGSWSLALRRARASRRDWGDPGARLEDGGFRCAQSAN